MKTLPQSFLTLIFTNEFMSFYQRPLKMYCTDSQMISQRQIEDSLMFFWLLLKSCIVNSGNNSSLLILLLIFLLSMLSHLWKTGTWLKLNLIEMLFAVVSHLNVQRNVRFLFIDSEYIIFTYILNSPSFLIAFVLSLEIKDFQPSAVKMTKPFISYVSDDENTSKICTFI